MREQLVIFGSGEIAELAYFYFTNDSDFEVVAFTVDDEYVEADALQGLPIVPFSEVENRFPHSEYSMHVALSYRQLNRLREKKYHQAKRAGYHLVSYICSKSVVWHDLTHGDNCFILENQTIQPTVQLGANVMLWSGNHIGHGTVIEDHAYLASHICIAGHCKIGRRTFFGVNAATRDFCTIGKDCFVAMNSSVTRSHIEDGSVVLGAKGSVLPASNELAIKVKRDYFGLES